MSMTRFYRDGSAKVTRCHCEAFSPIVCISIRYNVDKSYVLAKLGPCPCVCHSRRPPKADLAQVIPIDRDQEAAD